MTEKKNSVLIVDDDIFNINSLNSILNMEYTVYNSTDGKCAVETAQKFIPDIILLDVLMPDMNGYDVITALKTSEKTRNIPVVFITGLDKTDDEIKGLYLGAADYITKPFHPEIVKLRIQNLILRYEEKLNRTKINFLSRMNHEMRTPMNAILGILQMFENIAIPDKIRKDCNIMNKSAHDLMRLIDNMLDVSDIENDTFELSNAVFNFKPALRELLRVADDYAYKNKKQLFDCRIDPSIPGMLSGDEKRLKQVINTLIDNAIKFTPVNGEIFFDVRKTYEKNGIITLQFEVADSGIGITKEQQDKIFDIFEQADNSLTREYNGIGIGLASSKRIIEKMNGKIWVESEPGKGAKFYFTCELGNGE